MKDFRSIAPADAPLFGDVFLGFSQPQSRFIEQMLFGIALGEDISLKKNEKWLSPIP